VKESPLRVTKGLKGWAPAGAGMETEDVNRREELGVIGGMGGERLTGCRYCDGGYYCCGGGHD